MVLLAFSLLALVVYRDALRGDFVSDDYGYIVSHPWTETLDGPTLVGIFDPLGPAKLYAANYAPIHLLLTAIERQILADEPLGYHLVNVLIHAANATLLVALLLASGLPRLFALFGGLVFLVHPANVEAVAWASQLKTNAALLFSLAALVVFRRHPGWGTLLFVLGLLTKASAAFALPTAAAMAWAWSVEEPEASRRRMAWLAGWTLLFALYAIPQTASFAHLGSVEVEAYDDRAVHLRTIAGVGTRYLVMASTSYGVSAFHELEPAASVLDPWWLAAVPAALLLGWRLSSTIRRRSIEAAWWVAAAASFVPVSQLFPFLIPLGDRYLYFILPGLIGGTLCVATELRGRVPGRFSRLAAAAALVLVVLFAVRSESRAGVWQSELRLLLDAAEHYPEGGTASLLRARRAAAEGDVETALRELHRAAARGIDDFPAVAGDPGLAPLRSQPAFLEFIAELAGRWIERARERGLTTQQELRMLGRAHLSRDEFDRAEDAYGRALAVGGPRSLEIRSELELVQAERARREAEGASHRTR